MERFPIKNRVRRCEQCAHFVFADIEVIYCLNCGADLPPLIEIIKPEEVPPGSAEGMKKTWMSKLLSKLF